MPDSTFFGATLTNLGPVVTPFTPAPSCTDMTQVMVAVQTSESLLLIGSPDCGPPPPQAGCRPYGSDWDELYNGTESQLQFTLAYNSPGMACPTGWTTAGTIVGPSGWASADGAFTKLPHFPYEQNDDDEDDSPFGNFVMPIDQYVRALEPSETMAWCCPSGYMANDVGYCLSSVTPLDSYSSYSGVCVRYADGDKDLFTTVSSFDGSIYSDGILSPASPTEPLTLVTTYETRLLSPSETGHVIAAGYYAVVLVYKEEDKSSSTTAAKPTESGKGDQGDDKSGDDKGGGEGDGEGNGDGESAARSLRNTVEGLWGVAPITLAAGTVFLSMMLL